MKLSEMIIYVPDEGWLELTEEIRGNYKVFLGKCPHKYIQGEVLDYDVLSTEYIKQTKGFDLYSLLIKDYRKG